MSKTMSNRGVAMIVALTALLCAAFVVSAGPAHAYPTTQWITNLRLSGGNEEYSPATAGLVRSYGYSTGSAWSGAKIINPSQGTGTQWYYCSTNGCIASTPTFSCGSWYSGAEAGLDNHSSWADYFNGNYETC
jgi:hypothetical protein